MNQNLAQSLPLSAPAHNLQRLCLIRSIAWSGEAIATVYAYGELDIALPYRVISIVLVLNFLIIIGTLLRLRRNWPVTDAEFFLHLLADVATLSALLYLSGGGTNPFVSYFLMPLIIAAATLPRRYTYAVMTATLTAYTLLLFFYRPVELLAPTHHAHGGAGLNWHILGMWINFAVSAVLITFFIVGMARSLRQQDKVLQLRREKDLRNEHIIGIATMAANTAHALGTPLSTVAVLLNEIARSHRADPRLQQDIDTMKQQIDLCKTSLRALLQTSERLQSGQYPSIAADRFFTRLLEQWQNMRPAARYSLTMDPATPAPQIANAPMLAQALLNLLDNAADASPERMDINVDWNESSILFRIRDYGPGISLTTAEQIGKPFFSTKSGGLGLGLFLSHATLDMFAGKIHLFNQAGGGTLTEVSLPASDHD
ncbi:MAG TPA: HAMP domain-containing sensor histidine kinase [Gammaproteobacteria bacterium]